MKGNMAACVVAMVLMGGCSFNNVDRADYLKPYFDSAGVQGCFALYDNGRNEFTIYNRERYLQRVPAGGTFNIVTGLIGLETGKVFDEKSLGFKGAEGWTSYPPLSALGGVCTMDTGKNLLDNIRANNAPYFEDLARVLGKDTINNRIKELSYGNMDTTAPGRLTISADEQLGLVERLYFSQLPFQPRTQEVMRTVMERIKTADYTLAWSDVYTRDSIGRPLGWVLGWVEERRHPYFFVLNFSGSSVCGTPGELMRKILAQQGFFKGVK